eukprot:NODE_1568_length_1124_cov_106.864186_g1277_i0.p2 GENE.NODE_1568_length_1124_cov_106.864186_g1277_i0~~NODE_1568_length_1124_cov_106.864186_g1277_i0.p2  ORF type:complete len:128 (+),score=33.90 NODE_1568_length_1124_cov_106.864186_g1277_i0:360-743(+)
MQVQCQGMADAFNAHNPPKPVRFLDAWVVERKVAGLPSNQRILCVEPFINPGMYVKHNNNYGFVHPNARNTPQAFTHFTWHHTQQKMMVVDIRSTRPLELAMGLATLATQASSASWPPTTATTYVDG